MTIGIYKLNFKGTQKVYIGQSINIESRLATHISHVKAGTTSIKIINAFKDYGIPSIETLLDCASTELDELEALAVDLFDSINNGFNTIKGGTMPTPDNSGELNGQSKVSNKDIETVFFYLLNNYSKSLVEIAKDLGISYNIVNAISSCTNHKWLSVKYPEEYSKLESLKGRNNGKSAAARGIVYPIILSPAKEEHVVDNIRQFALSHGLERGSLCKLLNRKVKSHKGWVVKV